MSASGGARKLVAEWMKIGRDAILENWRRAERLEPLERSEGLE